MTLTVNGDRKEWPDGSTVADVMDDYVAAGRAARGVPGVAVAVNGEVVSRNGWEKRKLYNDDCVEVLAAIGGG